MREGAARPRGWPASRCSDSLRHARRRGGGRGVRQFGSGEPGGRAAGRRTREADRAGVTARVNLRPAPLPRRVIWARPPRGPARCCRTCGAWPIAACGRARSRRRRRGRRPRGRARRGGAPRRRSIGGSTPIRSSPRASDAAERLRAAEIVAQRTVLFSRTCSGSCASTGRSSVASASRRSRRRCARASAISRSGRGACRGSPPLSIASRAAPTSARRSRDA